MTSPPPPHNPLHPWDELPPEKLRPAHAYAAERDWPGYFAAVAGKPARETLLFALERFAKEGPPGHAVDLGCGEGRDAAELLARGWRVTAIDGHPEAIARVRARPDIAAIAGGWERLTLRQEMLEDVRVPGCDLLNSSYSLPFCDPGRFDELWARIVAAIRPGGRFAGQLFGDRDGWAVLPDRSHQTRARVEELLGAFEVESFQEEEKDGKDALEHPKHWHVFHVVARKR
jgi:tellurite methyltransferase